MGVACRGLTRPTPPSSTPPSAFASSAHLRRMGTSQGGKGATATRKDVVGLRVGALVALQVLHVDVLIALQVLHMDALDALDALHRMWMCYLCFMRFMFGCVGCVALRTV